MLVHVIVVDVPEGVIVGVAHVSLYQVIAGLETNRVVGCVAILERFLEVVFHALRLSSPAFSGIF